jgi:ABC-type multidrug transport system permease subunit
MISPLMKMLIALIAIIAMFFANLLILFARNKLRGPLKWIVSIVAYLLVIISFIFILIVVFSPS